MEAAFAFQHPTAANAETRCGKQQKGESRRARDTRLEGAWILAPGFTGWCGACAKDAG